MLQDILYIIALSLGSVLVLFILTKLMGYKQLSELSMFDYITGITIGSIAAEMSTALEEDFTRPLTAMIVYTAVSLLLSLLCTKSITARRFIVGKPLILYDNGKLYEENLKKCKIDVNEFLMQCRTSGYFDLSKLQTAILENNGKISFLPKPGERPLVPSDLSLKLPPESLTANLIVDGTVMEKNLLHAGKDKKWLENQIKGQGFKRIEDVLLATCDMQNEFHAYGRNRDRETKDILS